MDFYGHEMYDNSRTPKVVKAPEDMTKQEILDELKDYGVEATLRPRKSTLIALLKEMREESKNPPVERTDVIIIAITVVVLIIAVAAATLL